MMKSGWVFRRGDLYLANLGNPEGSRQGGVRPIVVLQNDVGNYYAPTLTLAPLTSKTKRKSSSRHIICCARQRGSSVPQLFWQSSWVPSIKPASSVIWAGYPADRCAELMKR